MWAVKGHYFTPFYNWPYTFGLLFGIGLYARYVDDPERFRSGYDDLLSTVGMADAATLAGRFGFDVRDARLLGREPRGAGSPHRRLRGPGEQSAGFVSARARIGLVVALVAASVVATGAPAGAAPAWSVVPTAAGAAYGTLAAVSCPRAASCFAVGVMDAAGTHTRLIERWNGAKWTAAASPAPPGATTSQLAAVHCSSVTSCVAVGQYTTAALVTNTLVMRWNGRQWTIDASPNLAGAGVNVLSGVSCASSTSCVAVGGSFVSTLDTSTELTLVEAWNGSTWSIVPSPNPSIAIDSALAGVTCTSATSCLAVGNYSTHLVNNTLALQWDGTSWTIVPSPNPGSSTNSELFGVSCSSGASCVAVGTGHGTLVERWNGAAWSIINPARIRPAQPVSA